MGQYALRTFTCIECGKEVTLRRPQGVTKLCSRSCFGKYISRTREKRVPKNKKKCIICGKEFLSIMSNARLCSKRCKSQFYWERDKEGARERWRKYYYKEKEYHIERAKKYYSKNKEKVKVWNNKATYKYKDKTRYDGKRKEILSQHNNKCDLCGYVGKLSIHHIDGVSYWNSIKANNEPDNLMVLCNSCHTKLHWELRRMKTKSDTPSNRRLT